MKPDLAARLAATLFDDTSAADIHAILRGFLADIAQCSACDGTGEVTVDRPLAVGVTVPGRGGVEAGFIAPGTTIPCPRCGVKDDERLAGRDPAFVAWHCVEGLSRRDCIYVKEGEKDDREEHAQCDYRVILPLDLFGEDA